MKKIVIFGWLIAIIFVFQFYGCDQNKVGTITPIDETALQQPKDYVGSTRCGECHDKIYYNWKSTKHPYKISEANKKTVVGDFWTNNTLKLKDKRDDIEKVVAKMSEKDGKFYAETYDAQGKMNQFEIIYNIGGIWKQRYLTKFPNGSLQVLPIQYNIKTREWVDYHGLKEFTPDDSHFWSSSERTWQKNCAKCHVTGFKMNFEDGKYESTWADNGAGCEGCHGPGSHHVNSPDIKKLDTVYNPARDHDDRRAAMTCGQCHNRGKSTDGKFGYPNTYTVGDELTFHYVSVTPEKNKNRFWPDGSSKAHHQQFLDFQKSAMSSSGMKCWSCHDPHKPFAGNSSSLRLTGNRLCESCHTDVSGSKSLSHSLHDNGNCQGCHMPKTAKSATTGDIASHTFFAIPPTATVELGGGDTQKQPNSCNLCHYHKKTPVEDLVKEFNKVHEGKATYDGKYTSLSKF
ncbi:MAG: hypothetical protein KKE12_06370 [Proteobacteria bacterium]|nr:hypothetical protein [Pseudomonadota bacterium]